MQRTVILGGVAFGLLVWGFATLERGLIALALPLFLYLGAGFFYAPREVHLQVKRRLSADRIQHGHAVAVTLTVTNHGPALENLWLQDRLPDGLQVLD